MTNTDTPTVRSFRNMLRKQATMQARVAREGFGRNHRATEESLDYRHAELTRLARTDEVLDAFEADEKLAAKWNASERRYYGLWV